MRELTKEELEFQERLSSLTADGPKMSIGDARKLANLLTEAPASLKELAPEAPPLEELGVMLQEEIKQQE